MEVAVVAPAAVTEAAEAASVAEVAAEVAASVAAEVAASVAAEEAVVVVTAVAVEVAVVAEVAVAALEPEPGLPLSPILASPASSSRVARTICYSRRTPQLASPSTTRSVLLSR